MKIRRKVLTLKQALFTTALLLVSAVSALAQQSIPPNGVSFRKQTRSELLERLSNPGTCGDDCRWDVAAVLGKRENNTFLQAEFKKSKNESQRLGMIYALYRINDPSVTTFFKRLIAQGYDDGEELYYPLNYLAKRCDPDALRVLSGNGHGGYKGYPGCLQWSTTVELFGKCNYRPAIPYLVKSIPAACMNIGIAAVEDLRKIYPGCPSFKHYSIEQIEDYFRKRAAADLSQPK